MRETKLKQYFSLNDLLQLRLDQGCRFRIVPAGTARIYRTVPSKPVCITPLFRTGKNTGRTGQFRAIPAGTGRTGQYRKKFFFFFSFVIFEFLLGRNGNLFALTYYDYLFS